jgi:acyl-CoA reductase-like NAD-dependent aldehyde dehydrogenase
LIYLDDARMTPLLAKGAFFRPAMLEPNSLDAPLVQKEVFAPVLGFETFSDEADALRRQLAFRKDHPRDEA